MTYSGFQMPGAFHNDGGTAVQTLFRPPGSPGPASASSSGYLDPSASVKRKRVGGGGNGNGNGNASNDGDTRPASRGFLGSSPTAAAAAPPQHTPSKVYALAGRLDTPGADSGLLGESMYSDSDFRTALGSKRSRQDQEEDSTAPTSLFTASSLHSQDSSSPRNGWGSLAMNTLGGVVGRVWEFCKAGAFKGFYAGGGRGFAIAEDGSMTADASMPCADEYSYNYHYHFDDYEHRIPGRFPASSQADDYNYNYTYKAGRFEEEFDSRPSTPGAKGRQTAQADDLGRNWVLVNDGSRQMSTPRKTSNSYHRPSPRNRNHAPSVTTGRRISTTTTPSSVPANATRLSYRIDSPSQPPRQPVSTASFASPRSSPSHANLAPAAHIASTASPAPQRSSNTSGHRRRRSANTHTYTHTPGHRRTQSSASTASSRGEEMAAENSPRLDKEAKQLAARRRMEERDADVRIAAFNKRLQDMIRQGKEALGTTIEVDDDGGGGGGGGSGGDPWVDE